MSDAAAEGLVNGPECLDIIPLAASQESAGTTVLIIVLLLQLHLGEGAEQWVWSVEMPHPLPVCL